MWDRFADTEAPSASGRDPEFIDYEKLLPKLNPAG